MTPASVVAIIGGGPAAAFTAELQARSGHRVIPIDEKLAWKKPCGVGITGKALTRYLFLREAQASATTNVMTSKLSSTVSSRV